VILAVAVPIVIKYISNKVILRANSRKNMSEIIRSIIRKLIKINAEIKLKILQKELSDFENLNKSIKNGQ
jgi:hypothetical protein